MGHDKIAVLNGGLPDWINQEYKTSALLKNNEVRAIIEDQLKGNLYIGNRAKMLIVEREKKVLIKTYNSVGLKYNPSGISSFHQSKDESIWIGHSMGISKLNTQYNSIKLYQPTSSIAYIPENDFGPLIEDHNGLIWNAYFNFGLLVMDGAYFLIFTAC